MIATRVDYDTAEKVLKKARGSVKVAIIMIKTNLPYNQALDLLKKADGFVRKAIESLFSQGDSGNQGRLLIISPWQENFPEKLPCTSPLSFPLLPYLLAGVPLGKLNEGISLKEANCACTSNKDNSSERKKKKKDKFY